MNNVRRVQTILNRFYPGMWTATEATCGGTISVTRADSVSMTLVEDIAKLAALFPGYIAYVTHDSSERCADGWVAAVWLTPRAATLKARTPRKPDRRVGDRRASARRISDKAKRRLRR